MLLTPPRDLKSKKEGRFRGQGMKFDRKMSKYGNQFLGHILCLNRPSAQSSIHSTNLEKYSNQVFKKHVRYVDDHVGAIPYWLC